MRFLFALVLAFSATVVRADDFIVIVFDTSGSMDAHMRTAGKRRMEVAQDAMLSVLTKVPDTTRVGILTFRGWVYDLDKVDRAKMETAIRSCNSGGGTPLYNYIKQGATRLLQERAKQGNVGSYKLLVVTDGEADYGDRTLNDDSKRQDGTIKLGVLKDIISRGVVVDTIGLDMSSDHQLKSQINGVYMRGDDPQSIQQSLKKAIAEVGFKGNDKVSEEIFREVGDLPDGFAKAAITGLTEFQNQPIGEQPPVLVVRDGVVVQEAKNSPVVEKSSGWKWAIGVAVFLTFIVLLVTILSRYATVQR